MAEVGKSIPRLDGRARVTGATEFVGDLHVPGMWHGATVRSSVAHGRIREIRWDPDFDRDSVAVVTAADIPGRNIVAFIDEDQPLLADGVVRHCDEAVVLIAAPDRTTLAAALRAVELDIEELPALLDYREADGAQVKVWGEDNVVRHYRMERGEVDDALAGAAQIIEGSYETGAQEHLYIEPQGVLAEPTHDDGVIVRGSMQCPYYVHRAVKIAMGLGDDQVRIIQMATGGAFGGKEDYPSILCGHAALLARSCGRPVKLIYDRVEDMRATTRRHPARTTIRTGIDADGNLLAADIRVDFDAGAYSTVSAVVLARGVIHAIGPYRCDHIRVEGKALATHHPPYGAFRGFGAPQTCFAIERHVDRLAAAVGLDPAEWRRRHALQTGDHTASGQQLTQSVGIGACLDAAIERSGWIELRKAAAEQREEGGRTSRGVGIAAAFHGAGFTGSGEDRIKGTVGVELMANGPPYFRVLTATTDMGQASHTAFCQIAADALGVEVGWVTTAQPDTDRVPDSGPTVASRSVMVVGRVVRDAALQVRRRLLDYAAQHGRDPFEPLDARVLAFLMELGPLREDASYSCPPGTNWDEEHFRGDAYSAYGWAADVVQVEVDRDTLEVRVTGFWTAHDVGRAINPAIVEGQVQGGSLQGLGYGWMEEIHLGEQGEVANTSFGTYLVPTAVDTPDLDVTLVEVPFDYGPFGAKGVGEISHDLPAPALVAAVEDATGLRLDSIPVTPERLLEACRREGKEWPWS